MTRCLSDGLLSLGKGEAAKAIRVFEYLSNTYSQNPQVRYHLARAYLLYAKSAGVAESRNAVESAESRLDEAIKLDPHFDQAILLLAELKMRKGTPAAAVDLLAPLIKEQPQIAQAHYLLASAYLAQQKRDDALAVYRQMTELFPKDPQPPFLVGSILLAQGQQSDARKAFEKSVEISPDYLPPVEKLVDLDIAEKQYATALDRVQKQIDKDPKLAQAWALKGEDLFGTTGFHAGRVRLVESDRVGSESRTGIPVARSALCRFEQAARGDRKTQRFPGEEQDRSRIDATRHDPGTAEKFRCSARRLRESPHRRAKFPPGSEQPCGSLFRASGTVG